MDTTDLSSLHPNSEALYKALEEIKPGQQVIYCKGRLGRQESAIAHRARELFEEGRLHLFQRRLSQPLSWGQVHWINGVGRDGFAYLAVGARGQKKNK